MEGEGEIKIKMSIFTQCNQLSVCLYTMKIKVDLKNTITKQDWQCTSCKLSFHITDTQGKRF